MNWNDLIISVCSVILTGLATWGLSLFTGWMNEKLKDKKFAKFATETLEIVTNCVKATYQTYVEAIKGTDMWTKEAQQTALRMALESAKETLSEDTKKYISETYGGLDEYLVNLIEAVLYDLKN